MSKRQVVGRHAGIVIRLEEDGVAFAVHRPHPGDMSVHDSSGRRSHADTDAYESASRETILVIESCRVTWLFDLASRRFRRVPTGAALDVPVPASAWTDYHALTFDKERRTFSISLNAETTRVHRSSYHLGPCALCGWNRHGQGVTS